MRSVIECEKQLTNSNRIAIIAHQSPDADALCSAVALKKLIRQNFDEKDDKIIDIFVDSEEIPSLLQPIVKNVDINQQNADNYDLVICVDCSNLGRLGKYQEIFNNAKT